MGQRVWCRYSEGLADPTRSRYKLFLNCVMILTSVIPPELPMELSIAVNTSLLALAQVGVFCTEPFRITDAGKVDVCCFDKTGTLTADDLHFEGVALCELPPSTAEEEHLAPAIVRDVAAAAAAGTAEGIVGIAGEEAALVLGACHALAVIDGGLVGDPLERAGMAGANWSPSGPDQSASRSLPRRGARTLSRHLFSSELRRMSVVCKTDGFARGSHWCLAGLYTLRSVDP
jgi:cation-transporting ATPase 13A1